MCDPWMTCYKCSVFEFSVYRGSMQIIGARASRGACKWRERKREKRQNKIRKKRKEKEKKRPIKDKEKAKAPEGMVCKTGPLADN